MEKALFNWGILGTGKMALQFLDGLKTVEEAGILAIGSNNLSRAEDLGSKFNIPRAYGSYDEVLEDEAVDIVYIATLNHTHFDLIKSALENGKHVLCEKPFTLDAEEAEIVIRLAQRKKLFLMEDLWTRFITSIRHCMQLLDAGAIGEIKMITCDFGSRVDKKVQRLFSKDLGGGVLYDRGIYCLSLIQRVFGSPIHLQAAMNQSDTEVDEQVGAIMTFTEGRMAVMASSIRTFTNKEIHFFGTDGRITIESPFYFPKQIKLTKGDQVEVIPFDLKENGFIYEIEEVMQCLQQGKLESNIMPLQDTLMVMKIMDGIRAASEAAVSLS